VAVTEQPTVIPRDPEPGSEGISSGFPTDLLRQSARRLQTVALLYATIFFLAGLFPALLFREDRAMLFSRLLHWAPPVLGIALGIVVALAARSPRIPTPVTLTLGLVFEVVSSYAIAAAEFAEPAQIEMHRGFLGLSWVAVWVVLFTVVVPTEPRRALVAALASVSSVPVVILIATRFAVANINLLQFFFGLVFPYLLVVAMAYVGARVVYQLGTEVKRARELGSYQLEEKLGEGGMGEVWRARHRLLARPAAIKLIRPAPAGTPGGVSGQALHRFEREAQVIARLRSPHTVDLFDFGVATDGAFYYAMELLEGLDADLLVRKFGPLPSERVVHVLQQVCHSLSEAHACGLVHRDIKPANIFLCRYGEEFDFVKVLDFGIVKAVVDATDTGPHLTAEHAIHGTPAFIAPEQAMGGEVDSRADIYATGCVAYWLLTGKPVFTADSTMGLLMQHARAQPTPAAERSGRPIPKALDDLVMACLAKEPADRPPSARELSRRLAAVHGNYGWTQEHAQAWWATHRTQS
jgi:serine/threonine-protein kinase